jgi:hypothetical protein
MRNSIKVSAAIVLSGIALWRCGAPESKSSDAAAVKTQSTSLPQDVLQSCTVDQTTFNSWFASGSATENGMVTPANSVTFPHQNNCDFYQWSERMFLWLTSPASGAYGQNGIVLESPVFYTVSPEDSAEQRTLIPHLPNTPLKMTSGLQKNGPNRLPVMRDKRGRLFEIETPAPAKNARALVMNNAGASVEVDHVQKDAKGAIVFMDKSGKLIQHPKAIIQHKFHSQRIVQRFALGKEFIFLDGAGNIIESEEGQATGDALMSRNGSLVYYLSFVNDVYAYYLTGTRNGQLNSSQFPTTAGARDSICAIARANGVTLPDSNALAMEIKTSWVEASTLSDPTNYITVNASIPVYDTSNPSQWIPIGEKVTQMAMVGMHIVGSVAGHPEMVWATFEQKNNTPNAAYSYIDVDSNVKTVPQDQGTNWLFNTNAADTPYNVSHMRNAGDTINAHNGFTISASNTLMSFPWGSAMDSVTNQEDGSSAASNSEVISINNNILSMLVGNDVRKNYLLIGATWTNGGAPPTGASYGSDTTPGVAIGTSVLANTTMETYFQTASTSCFTCHSGNPATLNPNDLSHIFSALQPLFDSYNANKKAGKK